MRRDHLYVVAAMIWGLPGGIIATKGGMAYCQQPMTDVWWLLLITLCVTVAFFFIFRRIVDSYSERIASLPDKVSFWQTFPLRGWFLLLFMACLGVAFKYVESLPIQFIASFYSGLGVMLLYAAVRFFLKRQNTAVKR